MNVAGVYIVVDGTGLAKIGVTADFGQRLPSLQTGSGRRLRLARFIEGAGVRVERWMHRRFADLRTHGEWFHWTDDMLTVIAPDDFMVPKVVVRRDIRLTLRERVEEASSTASGIGATPKQAMMMLCTRLTDEEAKVAMETLFESLRAREAA